MACVEHLLIVRILSTIPRGGTSTLLYINSNGFVSYANFVGLSLEDLHFSPPDTVPCMKIFVMLILSVILLEVLMATLALLVPK